MDMNYEEDPFIMGVFQKIACVIKRVLFQTFNTQIRVKHIYYPPEVRRREYWGSGVFLLQYFWKLLHYICINITVVG